MTSTLPRPCAGCRDGAALGFDFSMAFQPILDLESGAPYAYEALVRGPAGESAADVLARVTPENRYAFDQQCRVKAIETEAELAALRALGIRYVQGYLIARPGFEALPEVHLAAATRVRAA